MDQVAEVLAEAKALARKYRKLTGKPLGITGEVAEFAAADLFGLELADARQAGYDAVRRANGKEVKIQIKGRCIPSGAKLGQRLVSMATVLDPLLDIKIDPPCRSQPAVFSLSR